MKAVTAALDGMLSCEPETNGAFKPIVKLWPACCLLCCATDV
jgi:hypothetical protein